MTHIGFVDMKTNVAFLHMILILNTTFDLMSREPREQRDVSPCTLNVAKLVFEYPIIDKI